MGLFKTILYAALLYYGWKIARSLFAVSSKPPPPPPNNHTQSNNPGSNNDSGEYVDYEEIK